MTIPLVYDFDVYSGDDTWLRMTVEEPDGAGFVPADLTGHTILGQVKESLTTAVVTTFTVVPVDLATGVFDYGFEHAKAALLGGTAEKKYIYDIQSTSPTGVVRTYAKGEITVDPEVTT